MLYSIFYFMLPPPTISVHRTQYMKTPYDSGLWEICSYPLFVITKESPGKVPGDPLSLNLSYSFFFAAATMGIKVHSITARLTYPPYLSHHAVPRIFNSRKLNKGLKTTIPIMTILPALNT